MVFGKLLPVTAAPPVNPTFNAHIRPLLSDRCFACHGPDAKHREADLRLDTFEGATAAGAITPGQVTESAVWERITSSDPDVMMPPPSSKKPKFTADELETLKRWIAQGAEYEGHWSFLPVRDAPPPQVTSEEVRNPIDAFVFSRLQSAGLTPSTEADRATLIRRVTLDLTGLLPSPEEIEVFLTDSDPAAYEKLVERLLASPRYGERWGRHWLDQARYADSNGYSIDGPRDMWPYRDWVIEALNRDLPFDQFTIEQLAGDLLPSPTKSQLVATGFHRNTLINQEGGTDPEQFRVEATMDRANTTGAVWLGLTVGCAQCHSHKFDPLTQREYYELLAFFNSCEDKNNRGPAVEVIRGEMFGQPVDVQRTPVPPTAEQIAAWRVAWEKSTREKLAAASPENAMRQTVWRQVTELKATSTGGATFETLEDGSLLVTSPVAAHDTYQLAAQTDLAQIAAIRLRVLPDPSLPKTGPGRAGNGNFVLTGVELKIDTDPAPLSKAVTDHEQPGYPVTAAIDDDPKTGWAINVAPGSSAQMNAPHEAVFVLAAAITTKRRTLNVTLKHDLNANYTIGRFALDVTLETPTFVFGEEVELLAALDTPADQRTELQNNKLQQAFEQAEPRVKKKTVPPNPDVVQAMILRDLPQKRDTFLLTRGDFTRPDQAAGPLHPGVFASIPPLLVGEAAQRNRLDLARWLVDPEHPLTTRVTMNRLWMRYFGRGLVETEEDFGTQGSPPTHPELLDWLAREFVRQGWSQKAMHRLIVTSHTYRQSSHLRTDLHEKDPRNLLLGRQNRLRLDAEVIRDAALSASGALQEVFGGQSVYPVQPEGVYAFTQVNKSWPTESGPNRHRRTLYTFFYRSAPYPLLTTFDAPDFQSVCTRRIRSNTPLQALTVANDPVFLELAQQLAVRVLHEAPADDLPRRIHHLMRLCLSREATAEELAILQNYFTEQRRSFVDDAGAAEALVPLPDRDAGPLAETAAWVVLARTILNTDNFITRE
ncbi:DUF1553 domain-containing protein [bacterium]|nr:DUF1553 domain-containing protein [bacterium]